MDPLGRRALALGMVAALAAGFAPPAPAQCSVPNGSRLPRWPWRSTPAPSPVTGAEREPNDSSGRANAAILGATIMGTVDRDGDRDYFAFDVAAGTRLDLKVRTRDYGPSDWATLRLLDVDGRTVLAYSVYDLYDHAIQEPRIRYAVGAAGAGRYFVEVASYQGTGAPNQGYALELRAYVPPAPGPGDPAAVLVSDLSDPADVVAAPSGDVFVTDGGDGGRLLRVTPDGAVTTIASDLDPTWGLVVDRAGDVLVPACAAGQGVVWRVSPSGAVSRFFSGPFSPGGITVGPDGDVWVNDNDSLAIWRLDPRGTPKTRFPYGLGAPIAALAFSPQGELHLTTGHNTLYTLRNGTPQVVLEVPIADALLSGIAYDRDGYLYLTDYYRGRVVLVDPHYQVVSDPFALVGDHFGLVRVHQLAFARDRDGRMTRRLLVTYGVTDGQYPHRRVQGVAELNAAGIRAPGWPIGVTLSVAAVTDALLGVDGALSADAERDLDRQGNNNGRIDVGDLRAYLRAQGRLPGERP